MLARYVAGAKGVVRPTSLQLWSQTSAQDVLKLSEKLFVLLIPASASERSVAHKIPLSLLHFVKQPSREGETRNPLVPTQ